MSTPAPWRIAARSLVAVANSASGSGARTMTMSAGSAFAHQGGGVERRGDAQLADAGNHGLGAWMQGMGGDDERLHGVSEGAGRRSDGTSAGARVAGGPAHAVDQVLPITVGALEVIAHQVHRADGVAAGDRGKDLQVIGMRGLRPSRVARNRFSVDRQSSCSRLARCGRRSSSASPGRSRDGSHGPPR